MRRAFVPEGVLAAAEDGAAVELPEEAAHHLGRVLRLSAGDEVELFDGSGRTARGRFTPGPPAAVTDLAVVAAAPELPPLVVAQARVRTAKLEEVIRRATELGASAVWVFDAERSQPSRLDATRLSRLDRVATDAVRQSERVTAPTLEGPLTFDELEARAAAFPGVVALGVVDAELPLSRILADAGPERGLLIVIGPEGGLSDAEQRVLGAAGARPCRLGVHVLRTETAALAALAAAQAALGRL